MGLKESREQMRNCENKKNSSFSCKDCYHGEKQLNNVVLCNKDGILYR